MDYEEKKILYSQLQDEQLSIAVRKEIVVKWMKTKFGLNDFEFRYILGVFSKQILDETLSCILETDRKTDVFASIMLNKDSGTLSEPCFPRAGSYGLLQSKPIPILFQFDSCRVCLRLWESSLSDSDEICEATDLKLDILFWPYNLLNASIPEFDTARLYSSLRFLFGCGTEDYDPYSSTFGYRFHLLVEKSGETSEYLLGLTDRKGGWDVSYGRISKKNETDDTAFPIPRPPVQEEFAEEEMIRFSFALFLFLEEYHKTSSLFRPTPFVKENSSTLTRYGYRNSHYFEHDYLPD